VGVGTRKAAITHLFNTWRIVTKRVKINHSTHSQQYPPRRGGYITRVQNIIHKTKSQSGKGGSKSIKFDDSLRERQKMIYIYIYIYESKGRVNHFKPRPIKIRKEQIRTSLLE
jgi:hypothetical protein